MNFRILKRVTVNVFIYIVLCSLCYEIHPFIHRLCFLSKLRRFRSMQNEWNSFLNNETQGLVSTRRESFFVSLHESISVGDDQMMMTTTERTRVAGLDPC